MKKKALGKDPFEKEKGSENPKESEKKTEIGKKRGLIIEDYNKAIDRGED